MGLTPFYYRITEGMRITVRSGYLAEQSRPAHGQYVFMYFVRIENVGGEGAQLRTRRWLIHDSIGEELEVEGDGVVGEQPHLPPGSVHEYQSYCVLKSPHGYMEGEYHFVRDNGTRFSAAIPRFVLDAEGAVQID
jgi:ApaG protein